MDAGLLITAPTVDVEVSPDLLGALWGSLLKHLDLSTPPNFRLGIAAPDVAGIIAALNADAAAANAALARARTDLDGLRTSIEAASPTYFEDETSRRDPELGYVHYRRRYRKMAPSAYTYINVPPALQDELSNLKARLEKLRCAVAEENKGLNDEAFAAARPRLLAEHAAAIAKEEAEKAAAKVAADELAAERLTSGKYERETGSYNEKRMGPPWIAVVRLGADGDLKYDFCGFSTAKWGSEGLLSIACRPGDVIARGQKDHSKPWGGIHRILVMEPTGHMRELTRTEALKHLRSRPIVAPTAVQNSNP
jgi:hypothetical protein